MNRAMKWILPLVVVALTAFISAALVRAADVPTTAPAAGKGDIKGKVVDADGKPVADVTVSLFTPRKHKDQAAHTKGAKALADKPARPVALATATTDADGVFVLKDIEPGDYSIAARLKGKGMGRADVKVEADKTSDVTLTLKARDKQK